MNAGLDTSIMSRLLLGQPADQAVRAVAYLDELSRGGHRAVVSDLVVAFEKAARRLKSVRVL